MIAKIQQTGKAYHATQYSCSSSAAVLAIPAENLQYNSECFQTLLIL